ncbi:hypothetical protein POM88_040507 [Heracleum sosnowskyi]|uniref:Plastocyanin-like domain-containing protein n=1 Tax=Heracleum sosnowskyi TaxID=360622 RepID=A0AAD8HE85_9APIA|nr:hypothetical protein POM88_040507 [Heracleum sosnowskyi]
MLRPKDDTEKKCKDDSDHLPQENLVVEIKQVNPRELNPYLKDSGSGYPDDTIKEKARHDHLFSFSVVGDGGASWRLKALKCAKEQATRERWGSLGQLAVSVASGTAAPSRAAPSRAAPYIFKVRHYKFNVVMKNSSQLCSTKPIVTMNGRFPGPTLTAREGDIVLVKVVNHVKYNVSIHCYEFTVYNTKNPQQPVRQNGHFACAPHHLKQA